MVPEYKPSTGNVEYMVETLYVGSDGTNVTNYLSELARGGWRIIAATAAYKYNVTYTFERELQ